MATVSEAPSLDRWDIRHAEDVEWIPWGDKGNARAKILAEADGYMVVLVEAEAGYTGNAHDHAHAEFLYLLAGSIRNQGQLMHTGDAYAAASGSTHTDFEAQAPSTYLLIFRL